MLRSGHGWQDVDTVGWEISSLIGSFVDTVRPTRVEDLLSCVLVQQDQVPLQEAQERGPFPSCGSERMVSNFVFHVYLKAVYVTIYKNVYVLITVLSYGDEQIATHKKRETSLVFRVLGPLHIQQIKNDIKTEKNLNLN